MIWGWRVRWWVEVVWDVGGEGWREVREVEYVALIMYGR